MSLQAAGVFGASLQEHGELRRACSIKLLRSDAAALTFGPLNVVSLAAKSSYGIALISLNEFDEAEII